MIRLEYIATKDEHFRVKNLDVLRSEINKLPKGTYSVIIEKRRRKASTSQFGYLFGAVYPLLWKALLAAGWEFESLQEVDSFCKKLFANRDVLNRHTGEIIALPELKRNYKSTDMMTYINKIRDYSAEYLNTYIPSPEEQTQINFNQNENKTVNNSEET